MKTNNELSVNELLPKAIELVSINKNKEFYSTSWLQRQLIIGWNKACCLTDILEDSKLISAPDESGRRKILLEKKVDVELVVKLFINKF